MINFNSIPQLYNNVIKDRSAQSAYQTYDAPKLSAPLSQDCFQKSPVDIKTQQVTNNTVWDNKKIEQIYNKVFDEVMETIPIAKELNIPKPKLTFEEDETVVASYEVFTNTVNINPEFDKDIYLHVENFKDGGINIKVSTDENDKISDELKDKISDTKTTKLNEAEKELYFSSVFAHELRHCVQEHLLLSTKGAKKELTDTHSDVVKELKESCKEIIRLEKELAKLDNRKADTAKYEEKLKRYNYTKKYKPKKLIEDDAVLKYSLLSSDDRYWSTKEHFLKAEKTYDKTNNATYLSNPLEIDAFNFQAEYMSFCRPDSKELRDEVVTELQRQALLDASESKELSKSKDFPDFIKKN